MRYQLIKPRNSFYSVTEQILTNRGIPHENVQHYLHTSDQDLIDPEKLKNMREAATCLVKHINQNSEVLIQVDSDCDGMTSSAILINYLHALFPSFVENQIKYFLHKEKEHGLDMSNLTDSTKLIIIPDAGSNDYLTHSILRERGIDIIILDHHEATMESDDAIVVNNQLCDYPNKTLSGAGIVYKFCKYIDQLLGKNIANNYLDLAALGIIADVMQLTEVETRHIISCGLANVKNPYFSAMVKKQSFSLNGELTPIGVAFYIAPYINAMMRSGTPEEKKLLFESMLEFKAFDIIDSTKRGAKGQKETRAEQAVRTSVNVKNRQGKNRDLDAAIVEDIIEQKELYKNQIIIVTLEKPINKNLVGLIANQMMSKYAHPVLILNKSVQDGICYWEGSGRNSDKTEFTDFRGFLEQTKLVEYATGHASAFGTKIKDENLELLQRQSNESLKDFDFTPKYDVDFIFNSEENISQDILEIAGLKNLWGQGISESLVAIENINISKDNIQLLKGTTLKITLPSGLSLIKFRSNEDEYEKLYSDLGCVKINVVGTTNINTWGGQYSPQIFIEDYEIVGRTAYYF